MDGIDAISLVEKYGSPLYVYSANCIEQQYNRLIRAFNGGKVCLNYAAKALTNINVLKLMNKLGAGIDAVSVQEVKLALHAGYSPEKIGYTPSGVGFNEIEEAMSLGIKLTLDNLSSLEKFGQKYGALKPLTLRVNPNIMAGGNLKISTGHNDSKFGISVYQLPQIKQLINKYNIQVVGLHMHTGSDILDVHVFLKAVDVLLQAAAGFEGLKFIDFGSGFKVPYKEDDYSTDIELFGREVSNKQKEFCASYGSQVEFIFEPGKFLVSEAGYFLVSVNVVKETLATTFVGVDSGQNHLIRPMFYDAYHRITNLSNPTGEKKLYSVVGYICETDTFAWNRNLNTIKEGDILAFHNAGAYCFSMSSNYNSRFRPAEVLIYKGKDLLIRQRETMGDLLRNQVEQNIV
ncbi:MAG: diaminopimelate decarboxylase [Bacteroidales bacterium]|nr:diaminopimelate decarboxylase [Bacteroidales bacterium]